MLGAFWFGADSDHFWSERILDGWWRFPGAVLRFQRDTGFDALIPGDYLE